MSESITDEIMLFILLFSRNVIFKESKSKITTDGDSYVITFVINFQGE